MHMSFLLGVDICICACVCVLRQLFEVVEDLRNFVFELVVSMSI